MVIERVRRAVSDARNADEGASTADGESYGTVELNDRGRLTIPKPLRDVLRLEAGTEFTVIREGGDVRLVRTLPRLRTLTRGEAWGEEAFRDAGEATFGADD